MPNISPALVPRHIGTQSREAYPGTLDLTAWQVAALQRDKPGARDTGGHATAGFEGNAGNRHVHAARVSACATAGAAR
jgi:hypothetical protein